MTHEPNEYRESVTITTNIPTRKPMTALEYHRVCNLLSAAETLTNICRDQNVSPELQDRLGEVAATIESAKEIMGEYREITTDLLIDIEDNIIKN